MSTSARLVQTLRHCWYLGFTSFGGPSSHFLVLHKKFVEQEKWIDQVTWAEIFALGNASPGPASTTILFTIVTLHNGLLCGFLAFFMWSLPGALGMLALAIAINNVNQILPDMVYHLLTGMNSVVVGLLFQAGYNLSNKAITDRATLLVLSMSASISILYTSQWLYPLLVVGGGSSTYLFDNWSSFFHYCRSVFLPGTTVRAEDPGLIQSQVQTLEVEMTHITPLSQVRRRKEDSVPTLTIVPELETAEIAEPAVQTASTGPIEASESPRYFLHSIKNGWIVLAGFFLLLILVIVVTASMSGPSLGSAMFRNMLVAGTIIFGGGPVVIPLLSTYVVTPGWVSTRDFFLGLSIIQAFPGPNFNFAVYLGALTLHRAPALGALIAWLGIFLPGLCIRVGILPMWSFLRRFDATRQVLRGITAAAVGLIYAAIYRFAKNAIATPQGQHDLIALPFFSVVAGMAFVLVERFSVPPALAVIFGALAGLAEYGVSEHDHSLRSLRDLK